MQQFIDSDNNQTHSHKKRVLIVDDCLLTCAIHQRLLHPFETDIVTNGYDVLEKIQNNIYDCILMDIHLPDMTGIEITQKIRLEPSPNQDTLIIGISANTNENITNECIQKGMKTVITKPIQPNSLFALINQ